MRWCTTGKYEWNGKERTVWIDELFLNQSLGCLWVGVNKNGFRTINPDLIENYELVTKIQRHLYEGYSHDGEDDKS